MIQINLDRREENKNPIEKTLIALVVILKELIETKGKNGKAFWGKSLKEILTKVGSN